MTRTLPESTVDAWVAISLARQGSDWIWLPTTNQGSAANGTHPGDISSLSGKRLVLLENKGIENETTIDLGKSKGLAQNALLQALQEWGHKRLPPDDLSIGWAFYGLPGEEGPANVQPSRAWDGSDYSQYAATHMLICPHELSKQHVPVFRVSTHSLCSKCLHEVLLRTGSNGPVANRLPLDSLVAMTRLGLVGLPVASLVRGADQVRSLISGEPALDTGPDLDGPDLGQEESAFDLLDLIGTIAVSVRAGLATEDSDSTGGVAAIIT